MNRKFLYLIMVIVLIIAISIGIFISANKRNNENTNNINISNENATIQESNNIAEETNWWGDVPKIILTLLDNYNLDEKTVIPFCTSGGSGINQSENTLKSYNTNINWLGGKRFSSSSTKSEVSTWIQDLNIK